MAAAASSEAAATVASAAVDHPSPRSGRSNRHHHNHHSHVGVRRDPEAAVIPPAEHSDRPLYKQPMATPEDDGSGQEFGGNAALEAPLPSNRGKKQAWRRPANGSVDSGPDVMGAASWPALSESAKASPKSVTPPLLAASDSPKSIGDGSARVSNLDLSSTPNNAVVGRQRSFKRGGVGSNSNTSGALPDGGVPPQSFSPAAYVNKPAEVSQEDRGGKSSNWEHGSRGGSSGGDYQKGFRRGNNGGGSHHHNNYGNRRDQERGGYDGYHRGRDVHMQQHGPRPLIRPPPPMTPPFISPPPLFRPPLGNPVVYPDVPSPVIYVAQPPETFRGFPFIQHPTAHPVAYIPPIDTQRAMLLKQIDYYFSPENLCKDIFLRQNMDDQGWVPLSLIAGFNRVKQLTDNLHYILDTVRFSTIVELQGEKIRRRNEWMNWVLPSNSQLPAASGQQSPATPDTENLSHRLQTIAFGESTEQNLGILPSHNSSVLRRSASGNIVNAQAVEHKDQS